MNFKYFHGKSLVKRFRKQLLIGAGIVTIIMLVVVYNQPQQIVEVPKDKTETVFNGVTSQAPSLPEVMQQHLTNFEADQQKINQQNAQKLAQLESENFMYKQATLMAESNAAKINDKLAQLNTIKATESSTQHAYVAQKIVIEDDIDNDIGDLPVTTKLAVNDQSNSPSDSLNGTSNRGDTDTETNTSKTAQKSKDVSTYIPSNSFVKGVLINSLSANTGGNASTAPTPMLVRITDLAQLPNSFRSNIKSCMVGANGWGDLSTERVKTRLTTLSCVLKSGKAIDMPVKGYISGEDAKTGIKGMVVTHSGTIAAKAALAGFLQGIGTVGQAMGQTQTITPLGGVTTTISPNQAVMAGSGAGVSQVGSTLSQYYLAMMQQISPAIEVSAGRHVTIVFEEGIELKLPINAQTDINDEPLPLNQG